MEIPSEWAHESFCYVTTVGRRTGRPHTIEIWFGLDGETFYLLSGGGRRSDWVRNLVASPEVTMRVGDAELPAVARVVDDATEESRARPLLAAKYQGWREGAEMSEWARTALVIAIEPAD